MKTLCLLVLVLMLIPMFTLAQEDPPQYITQWGTRGFAWGQFHSCWHATVDANGNVFTVEQGTGRVQKWTNYGEFILGWRGGPNSDFHIPVAAAVDANGNVYVVDDYNHRVQKFTNNGVFLSMWGTQGTGDGQFNYPTSIAIDGDNNAYVVDGGNQRVQKFTSDGVFLAKWGTPGSGDGEFIGAVDIAVDSNGNVYVAELEIDRVQKFTSDGVFLAKWGTPGSGDGEFENPYGIAVDASGSVYVADSGNYRVQKFTSDGVFLAKWGTQGTGDGEFGHPTGVTVDVNGNIYVSDYDNYRMQKFGYPPVPVTISLLNAERRSQDVHLTWQVNSSTQDGPFFNVYRGETKLTSTPLTGQQSYELVDYNAPRTALEYWLVEEYSSGVKVRHTMSVGEAPMLAFKLGAYPNPFNPSTTVRFTVPKSGQVSLSVYDSQGRLKDTLIDNEFRQAQEYDIAYNPRVASGVYFLRLIVDNHIVTEKLTLLK